MNENENNLNSSINDVKETFDEDSRELKEKENVDTEVVFEDKAKKQLIYGVSDTPPIHVTIICGLQVKLQRIHAFN